MDKQNETLRGCGTILAALEAANPNASANWITEFVRSPKLRLAQYVKQLVDAGMSESADARISAAVDGIDCDAFTAMPDTLSEEKQGIVWLGYYAGKSDANRVWTPEKLKSAFDASGMTQLQVSEATGIAQGRVSEHLSGKMKPRPAMLRKYESAFGLKPGSLK